MQITTIGLDIAKNVFQVHGISREAIDNWRKTVAHPRLIIIDVFGKVRQARCSRDSFYDEDYRSLEPLKGTEEVCYPFCRKHGRYRVAKRRALISLLIGGPASDWTPTDRWETIHAVHTHSSDDRGGHSVRRPPEPTKVPGAR